MTATAIIDPAKPKITVRDLKKLSLAQGAHNDRANGLCAMEAAAWLAGETHSDRPDCVCPIIGAFLRAWNDGLPTDADRDRLLKPLLPLTLNTKADKAAEEYRAFLCIDWLVREFTPTCLELCDGERYKTHVAALRAILEITDWHGLVNATPTLVNAQKEAAAVRAAAWDAAWDAARGAAWGAARAAAWDAAWAAAWGAARAAAWDAAWDAAQAAAGAAVWAAAWDAAWAAARGAARGAARDAAKKKLAPATKQLQKSAADLVKRMCAA